MNDDYKNKIELLKLTHDLKKYYHAALWEEEKHYTWFIATILGANILTVLGGGISVSLKPILVILLSFLGLVVSRIAYKVISKECEYFQIALFRTAQAENAVFWDNAQLPSRTSQTLAISSLWRNIFFDKNLSVREYFLFTFVLSEFIFAILAAWAVYEIVKIFI
jgi:hypothetical protein